MSSVGGSRWTGTTPADGVTLVRAVLVAGCAVRVLTGRGRPRGWGLPVVAGVAWALDGVDGYVARRTGTVSERGGRWDNTTDATLVAVLATAVAGAAPWAPAGAALYPAYRLGQRVRQAWRRPLPGSRRGKVVGGVLTGTLLGATVPGMPRAVVRPAVAVAVGLVTWSFAVDLTWLERQARS